MVERWADASKRWTEVFGMWVDTPAAWMNVTDDDGVDESGRLVETSVE